MDTELFNQAKTVRENAYAPYSGYKVGAAVRCGGRYYSGCNVENVSFTITSHAEMNAIDTAIAAGETVIDALCVVVDAAEPVFPCALCRQKIAEFSDSAVIYAATVTGKEESKSISELYPNMFSKKDI